MKTILIIFLIILFSVSSKGQVLKKVLVAFKLPDSIEFNTKGVEKEFKIKDSYFDVFNLHYDELNELRAVTLTEITDKKLKKNKEVILETLRGLFGQEYAKEDNKYGTDYLFQKDGLTVKFEVSTVFPILRIYPTNNIKTIEKYDEFNKTTTIKAINYYPYVSKNGVDYAISFISIKETKNIFMSIVSTSVDWSFITKIKILLQDGEVIEKELTTSRDVVNGLFGVGTKEVGITDLDDRLIELILISSPVKIRIEGKFTADFILPSEIIEALKAVYLKTKKG